MSRKLQRVVGCLSRNSNVVGVGFAQTCTGDADEFGFGTKLLDIRAADVAHPTAQSANHLEEHVADRALVGNAALDPLWHQLSGAHLALLEIPVGAAVLHRGEAAHASNHL